MAGKKQGPDDVRFWSKVTKTDTCWLWTGVRVNGGYGSFGITARKKVTAHRMAYELVTGSPVPAGLELDHLCRVRNCVNPAHLEPVTHAENMRRSEPANRTHCLRGHVFDAVNTRQGNKPGQRRCRACEAYTARRRAA